MPQYKPSEHDPLCLCESTQEPQPAPFTQEEIALWN